MGVDKEWRFVLHRFRLSPANLALLQQKKQFCSRLQRKPISWSFICGLMLFSLGLISLFTGHVVSDLDWYSQRLIRRSLYSKLVGGRHAQIDIWKSKSSQFYYGCSERGPHFAPALRERSSNGYLLIATSGGLNQQRTGEINWWLQQSIWWFWEMLQRYGQLLLYLKQCPPLEAWKQHFNHYDNNTTDNDHIHNQVHCRFGYNSQTPLSHPTLIAANPKPPSCCLAISFAMIFIAASHTSSVGKDDLLLLKLLSSLLTSKTTANYFLLIQLMKRKEDKIAVVVSSVANGTIVNKVPSLKNVVSLGEPMDAREVVKHYGKAHGVPTAYNHTVVCPLQRPEAQRAMGQRNSCGSRFKHYCSQFFRFKGLALMTNFRVKIFQSVVIMIKITDAVAVARILNATLVVPELDHHSFWKDDSDFFNIFDVDWFISSLAKDVTIIKRIPDKVMRSMEKPPYTMRVPRKSTPEYYLDQVLPILLRRRAVQLTKFDYRLANSLDEELQKLRCRVNYHALRFTKPIRELGQKLVMRMRNMAKRFIAIHLRFEPDMLAFSGCYYGGGDKERNELGEIRKRWVTLPDLSPEGERKRGKCPLTPHEVGLMLRALGFENDTYLYVASGEIYGGEETLQPLRKLFPNFYTKEMLANEELKPFLSFSSRLAAIDYIVCDESDVFVTNNNGNMAKILAGRRRYMGHKRTIRPNAKKLSSLFMARQEMDWNTFARKVKSCQRGFMGEPEDMRLGRGEFHEFPSSCICRKPFQYDNIDNNNDREQPAGQDAVGSKREIESGKNGGEKSLQRLKKESTREARVSPVDNLNEELFPNLKSARQWGG
ncbi:hypothetical protein HHK36_028004 [Tetracentron sinense]|uniref:O-fucosyltransferase family protein n=1 Tax=Tetracentron sinense TaxID=13715 RepID=A0A835D1R3_TETSI|nr:hypothetical protein HHK36_028004 [Tetracentron sinense]